MVNVVVGKQTSINIQSNNAGIIHTNRVTLQNTPSLGGATRFDNLEDIDASSETDGSVPVYDAETGKYVVKLLDLDGGEF